MCRCKKNCNGIFYSGSYLVKLTGTGGIVYSTLFDAGVADGKRIIAPTVMNTMAPSDMHTGFLTWWPFGVSTGEVLYMHNGGDNGVRTIMAFSRRGKRGVIILTNGEGTVDHLAAEIYVRLVERRGR